MSFYRDEYIIFLFRSLTLDYVDDVDHLGVTSKRFMTTNMTFANGTHNPANACFDTDMKLASGAQDISRCQYGKAETCIGFKCYQTKNRTSLI